MEKELIQTVKCKLEKEDGGFTLKHLKHVKYKRLLTGDWCASCVHKFRYEITGSCNEVYQHAFIEVSK